MRRALLVVFVLALAIVIAACSSRDISPTPQPKIVYSQQPVSVGIKNGTVIPGTKVRIDFVPGSETVPVNIWRDGSTQIECSVKQRSQVTVLGYGTRVYLGGETERQPLVSVVGSFCTGVLLRDWLVRIENPVGIPASSATEAMSSAETIVAASVATRRAKATQAAKATDTPPAKVYLTVLQNSNLRNGPSTDGDKVGSVSAGTNVEILARSPAGDWLYVRVGDIEAWIARFLVEDADIEDVSVRITSGPTDQ